MADEAAETGKPWTAAEVAETTTAYFRMLRMQELGQHFVKAQLVRELCSKIPARNTKSIEYKFRNISAVLNGLGVQTVSGYKPLPNIQHLLIDVVADMLAEDKVLDEATITSVEKPVEPNIFVDFASFVKGIPAPKHRISEQNAAWIQGKAIKRDYLERESRNRSLGHAGELLVMEYEVHRLHAAGAKRYVDRIDHISNTQGDGLGYDIRSFEVDGRERYIEVKTTAYDAETPFFISPNEVNFSKNMADQFHLYRVFSFRKKPQMFIVPGSVDANFKLDPASFRATVLGT